MQIYIYQCRTTNEAPNKGESVWKNSFCSKQHVEEVASSYKETVRHISKL